VTDLSGKVAFVTGAARGQGRSHAVGLAAAGADVVVLDICSQIDTVAYPMSSVADLAETVRLVERQGVRALPVEGDVRSLETMRAAVDHCIAELHRLDIVVANAGIMVTVGAHGDDDQAFYDSIDVMLTGVWHTLRAAAPPLVERGQGGSIIITSSTAGMRGLHTHLEAGSAGYVAAKHGVVGLMRMYANVLAPHSIRVNTVHPTGVDTPMVRNSAFQSFTAEHPDLVDQLRNALPQPLLDAAEVTNAVVWLASDRSRFVTGVELPVDAGFLVRT
jgi:SDR family mycofactocin-dependent oxidoreductase